MYDRFVEEEIRPDFGEDFIYQSLPSFRIHLPNDRAIHKWHYDSDEDHMHPHWEINIQVPLTGVFGTNATWLESVPGLGDFHPVEMKYGQYTIFDGNRCKHGNQINTTGVCRVGFDFRVLPISRYDPKELNETATTGRKFIIGDYYRELGNVRSTG